MRAAWKTLPFSVASPTAVTRMSPCPSTTFVPRRTAFEGNVASGSKRLSSVVLRHIGSPVSDDSSMPSDAAFRSVPSAGTSQPVVSATMSPTTMSRRGTFREAPSRITSTPSSS